MKLMAFNGKETRDTRTPKQMGSAAGIVFILSETPRHKHTENKFSFSSVS